MAEYLWEGVTKSLEVEDVICEWLHTTRRFFVNSSASLAVASSPGNAAMLSSGGERADVVESKRKPN